MLAVLINMSKVLGVQVVAEGVESAEQLHILQTLDCDFIQGYYFSKPLPADALLRFLQTKGDL